MQYKIVIFDIDGVIFEKPEIARREDNVAASSWDSLFERLDIYDLHERLKELYMRKGFRSYNEWTEAACCVLKAKGLDQKTFEEVINSRKFMAGAVETVSTLSRNDIVTSAVSGSFGALARRAKIELGIDDTLAHCDFKFDENGILKDWKLLATDYKDKVKFVKYLAQLNKVGMKECAYVGDDVNDMAVFERVGLAIAFNSYKEKVRAAADVVIEKKDLREILPHLRIKK